ncbi:MAG TPA: hypothetical protein VGO91_01175 [Pyrinomonadaceae bacterium]|jgi:hypothetical protein|nr:hypothetical protein [Pyrinomonadaceae bacterium]
MSLYLCLLSFILCYLIGRRSLHGGLAVLFGVGYLYGIVRANLPETFSHFIFDAGVIGLYAAQLFRPLSLMQRERMKALRPWLEFLMIWPLLLFFLPIQDILIQFVGLRGNIFLLPFLLFGARLEPEAKYKLALWIAGLNVLALAFAGAEFFLGVERFFPYNEVTKLIYLSRDVSDHTAFRIPSTFVTAHAFGGTMIITMPFILGALVQKHKPSLHGQLLLCGLVASMIGVLLSAARLPFLVACVLIIVTTFSLRTKFGYATGWLLMLCAIGWMASSEQRLQRFMELRDTDMVAERISWSVNMTFFEIAARYPFGNGLGGGGTSIPYFLRDRIDSPVLMENEYARILLEQGILGLIIWVAFITWLLTRRSDNRFDSWYVGRRLAWVACAASFGTGLIGTGLLTSVPHSCLLLLLAGWVAAEQPSSAEASASTEPRAELDHHTHIPTRQYG